MGAVDVDVRDRSTRGFCRSVGGLAGIVEAIKGAASGWINDIYAGAGPTDPIYGVYGPTGGYLPPGGQQIILGQASGIVLP
jgi:hypothetical protein